MKFRFKKYCSRRSINKLCKSKAVRKLHDFGIIEWAFNNPNKIAEISLCFLKGKPIGIGVSVACYLNINIYVKKKYRRKGIGTKLFGMISNSQVPVRVAIHKNVAFFKKVLGKNLMSKRSQVVEMNVRGVSRKVYLTTPLNKKTRKARARVYVNGANTRTGRTTVSGVYSINSAGQRRFTPNSDNAGLL